MSAHRVGEPARGRHVGEVAPADDEVRTRARRPSSRRARRPPRREGAEEGRDLGRVVLAISVEGESPVVAGLERMTEPRAEGRTLARVRPLLEDLGAGLARHAGGGIGRAVVHHEDGEMLGGRSNDGRDPWLLVVGGDQGQHAGRYLGGVTHARSLPSGAHQ